MGGEKHGVILMNVCWPGSPPHGRGKEVKDLREAIQLRITPAWAGKSEELSKCVRAIEDHPRMGGEKFL